MKRIILLCSIFLLSNLVYSQEQKSITYVFDKVSNSIERVYSDGTKVVEATTAQAKILAPKLEKALESLSTQLKVSAQEVWDILIKQQLVWSICILLALLVTIFSWFHFYYRINEGRKNEWKTSKSNTGNPSSYHIVAIVTLAFAITGTILVGCNFQEMMTGFINPKFGALQTIATIAQQIK